MSDIRVGRIQGSQAGMAESSQTPPASHSQHLLIERISELSRDLQQFSRQGNKHENLRLIRDGLVRLSASGAAGMHLEVAAELLTSILLERPHLCDKKLQLVRDAMSLALADLRAQAAAGVAAGRQTE